MKGCDTHGEGLQPTSIMQFTHLNDNSHHIDHFQARYKHFGGTREEAGSLATLPSLSPMASMADPAVTPPKSLLIGPEQRMKLIS